MNPVQRLRELGQSLWLDNITRDLLDSGRLAKYIDDRTISGLTSNPTIFDRAMSAGTAYDAAILTLARPGRSTEDVLTLLALDDLGRAADLFRPAFHASGGSDGWVSMEISPLLAGDAERSMLAAARIHRQAQRPNLFVKIPGTAAGEVAIEASIFAGIPVNVTLLFSRAQYLAAAEAYMRAIEARIARGLDPRVASVASVFVSRWDRAANRRLPAALRNRLGIAMAQRCHRAYRTVLVAPRWRALAAAGAMPQRLLWASTGVKEPQLRDDLYVSALAAPETINTLPESTLQAFIDHGAVRGAMRLDGGDDDDLLAGCAAAGVELDQLAASLQREGVKEFAASWTRLLARIGEKQLPRIRGHAAAAPSVSSLQ